MLHNLESINKLYKAYQSAGAALNKAVVETFKEVFDDFGSVPINIESTSVRPSIIDGLDTVNKFYFDKEGKLFFEATSGMKYPIEQIAYRPLNMYLIYQSFAKEVKVK